MSPVPPAILRGRGRGLLIVWELRADPNPVGHGLSTLEGRAAPLGDRREKGSEMPPPHPPGGENSPGTLRQAWRSGTGKRSIPSLPPPQAPTFADGSEGSTQ